MSDAIGSTQIFYIYDTGKKWFKRNILDTRLTSEHSLTEEDIYWLNQETISLEDAKEFLLTASTWAERFGSDFTVKADVEPALSVRLLKARPHANQNEAPLEIDIRWYLLPDSIEELYSPLGFVICKGELVRGVFPKFLRKDLTTDGKKQLVKDRLQQFLRDEWELLQRFSKTENVSLEPLLVPLNSCKLIDSPRLSVQIGDYSFEVDKLPEVYDRYGIFALEDKVFYGDQLYSIGLRPFKSFFTGTSALETNLEKEATPTDGVFRVLNPGFWYKSISFRPAENMSDVFLAGERDFTFIAGQVEHQPTTHEKALAVIKELKEAVSIVSPDHSFDNYRRWQESFVSTGDTGGNPFYCLIFMQELLNELFKSDKENKFQMFWRLWQTVSKAGSRELKGRFIEAAIDWSLIEQHFGIYGYMSTLKNGYMHNALLWQAFLPENRDYLDTDLLFELANQNSRRGVFAEKPQYKRVVSLVFGKIDDFYREKTGAPFFASFHPDYFVVRAYMPYKDQIYTGFVKKLMLAELTPLVFHKPLVNFAAAVFLSINNYLKDENEEDLDTDLPKPIDEIVRKTVSEFLKENAAL